MQDIRRSNQQRSDETRSALIAAARALFIVEGFAATSTPDIVAAAGVTRGALYHHFKDKKDLFRAVLVAESAAVAKAIELTAPSSLVPIESLLQGANAYLDAMQVAGRTRLMLIDGPAVLGASVASAIDSDHAEATLRAGLEALLLGSDPAGLDAMTDLLSAAFDRAALAINEQLDPQPYRNAIVMLLRCLSNFQD